MILKIIPHLLQDVNYTWKPCFGLKGETIYLKVCKNDQKICFAVRMEWVNVKLMSICLELHGQEIISATKVKRVTFLPAKSFHFVIN